MKRFTLALAFVWLVRSLAFAAAPPTKPADLPERYRDFKIYATSAPDPADPAHIVMTVQVLNEGKKPLAVRVTLDANKTAGVEATKYEGEIQPNTSQEWRVDLHPADGLKYEVLNGQVFFGKTRARDLYIAVQGPDPAGFKSKEVQTITAKAEVVACYAPSVQIDWWRTDHSASVDPSLRKEPLITLASNGKSDYTIVVPMLPKGDDGQYLSLDAWSQQPNQPPGQKELIAAVRDLQRCLKIMSDVEIPISGQRPPGRRFIELTLGEGPRDSPDFYRLFTTRQGEVVVQAGHIDGLRQGVYGLLTDHFDCHWFQPGELGEEIPRPTGQSS